MADTGDEVAGKQKAFPESKPGLSSFAASPSFAYRDLSLQQQTTLKSKSDRRAKRAPPRPIKTKNTILVHRKSDFKTQLEKCQRLLDKGKDKLQIHGLGAAINRSVNMALQLQLRAKGSLKVTTTTSTVDLVDDFEPLREDIDPYAKSRSCSAIHIILTKIPVEKLIAEENS